MVEVSMADVADGGFVVGAALMNSKPIYVIRYQGFNWYNLRELKKMVVMKKLISSTD